MAAVTQAKRPDSGALRAFLSPDGNGGGGTGSDRGERDRPDPGRFGADPTNDSGFDPRNVAIKGITMRETLAGLGFVVPALAVYLFYFLLPIPLSTYYSLFNWDGLSPLTRFIGLGNFERLLTNPVFWQSFGNNIRLVILSLVIQLPFGLALGLIVSSKLKGTGMFKLLYFIPMTISAVAIGITWKFIYAPNYGLLNTILRRIGLDGWTQGWLGEPNLAFGAIVAAISWQHIPFYMVLFAAGLAGIPRDLIESAYIDGATGFQSFLHVTIPLLVPTIRTAAVLSLTGSLKYFALIFVMTGGGPNHASELMATYMYKQAFTNFSMGYGSSVAVVMFVIAIALTILILTFGKKGDEDHVG